MAAQKEMIRIRLDVYKRQDFPNNVENIVMS